MTKGQKKIIERCYKNLLDLRDEAVTVQQLLDEIKDDTLEGQEDYNSLYNANNNLDSAITSLDDAAEYLLIFKIKNKL